MVRSRGANAATAFVIENTITSEYWAGGGWTVLRWEAKAFPTYGEADHVLLGEGLDKVLGAEVAEYLKDLLELKRPRGRKHGT